MYSPFKIKLKKDIFALHLSVHFVPNVLSYYQCEVHTERDKQGRGNPRSVPQYAASYWCILYWENIQRQGKYVKNDANGGNKTIRFENFSLARWMS